MCLRTGLPSWLQARVRTMTTQPLAQTNGARAPYQLKPFKVWGAEVYGIDLKQPVSEQVVERIKRDVTKYRVVVFRDQGVVSGQRQVEISQWFGPLESTFYKHARSPHPDVFRVSNVDTEGCTGVGRTGWHIDGSFQEAPFSHSTYHIVSVPLEGATVFAPLREVIKSLPEDKRQRWERLYMSSDRRSKTTHPIIYSHPQTGDKTMCFHTGMTAALGWDLDTPAERIATYQETEQLLQEIEDTFQHDIDHLKYRHQWREGDFIISDNLAVGHEASPDTQRPVSEVGLRVMHRTTIAGNAKPCKDYATAVSAPASLAKAH
ncbi:hypothetical protein WJX72_008011 [[Myrmecia] bisecta]|uniref:TauD/TfdA-like domain-containing protein n=1 Tax=[Myrmecia] bisecta TaxID=41462 RepID=A0AAW1P6H8_9CHLO